MKQQWLRLGLAVVGMVGVGMGGFGLINRAKAQTSMNGAAAKGKKAGEFFKNVTTSTLKELPVDDFVGAMGVLSAALGLDCADCHPNAGSDNVNWVIDTPRKNMTRRMVEMVANINRTNFSGAQMVSCWTCHHGKLSPATSIQLDTLYDTPNAEEDDIVRPDRTQPSADAILDKYIQAMGGAQRLAGLTSFVGTGSAVGYEGLGGNGDVTVYAKAPNQRSTTITFKDHPERGESVWAFNGAQGLIKTPRALLLEYDLAGSELDAARFEAQLGFPGQVKTILNNWRVGTPRVVESKDKEYAVVQGTGPRNFMATLYFDQKTGLLERVVRFGPSPIGRINVQLDFGDYRDVNGIKFPFEISFFWLDGKYTAKMQDYKVNVPIDAVRFTAAATR